MKITPTLQKYVRDWRIANGHDGLGFLGGCCAVQCGGMRREVHNICTMIQVGVALRRAISACQPVSKLWICRMYQAPLIRVTKNSAVSDVPDRPVKVSTTLPF